MTKTYVDQQDKNGATFELDSTFAEMLKTRGSNSSSRKRSQTENGTCISRSSIITLGNDIDSNSVDRMFSAVSDESFIRLESYCSKDNNTNHNQTISSTTSEDASVSYESETDCLASISNQTSLVLAIEQMNLNDSTINSEEDYSGKTDNHVDEEVDYESAADSTHCQFNDTLEAVEYFIEKGRQLEIRMAEKEKRSPNPMYGRDRSKRFQVIREWAHSN